jgi:hypothetical protein
LPDVTFKVVSISLLNYLDVKHLAREKVRLYEYGKLMSVMFEHVDVVSMGFQSSDSAISCWSAQASARVFNLVLSSDGIGSRIKKRLEYLSWITIYKMMLEVNKYDEKMMWLEMAADVIMV